MMSTGIGDRLHFSDKVSGSKPKRPRILSSVVKLINGSCLEISEIDSSVEKFGLIVNGYSTS